MPGALAAAGTGLSRAEAERRLAATGPNSVPEVPPRRLIRRVADQLRDPLILLLLAAMAVTVVLRDATDATVIGLVIVLNTTVGIIQEVRADRAVAALRQLSAPTARVVRDGREQIMSAELLVPGDLVRITGGDIVPADMTLVETARLRVNEAALTGESVPVDKGLGEGEQGDLLAGTVVVTGRGTGVVGRTGPASALGRITALVAAQPRRLTPLQRRLVGLGRILGAVTVGLSVAVMVAGLLRGLPLPEMVLTGVSLTVAAIPESLPAVVTVALALGARRMARRSAIVRRLPAVETLGSVTVLATDKTGTLTEGRMRCERIATQDAVLTLSGPGYQPTGTVTDQAGTVREPSTAARELARDILLCNDARLAEPTPECPEWTAVGDPMEAALLAAAGRLGLPQDLPTRYPRVDEIPFDATRMRMTTVHRCPEGGYLVLCKGAPEVVLPLAPPPPDRGYGAIARYWTDQGYRVLAVAQAWHDEQPTQPDLERGLAVVGLVALTDPVRVGAAGTVRALDAAGIRLMLITGDHPGTAAAVAGRVGLPAAGRVCTGRQIEDGEVAARDAVVVARTHPEQKMGIVRALQADGQVVAMTGDGVNDAPALRQADIGVAMGRAGTEAARQAADLVLADDQLATVGVAVREGRRIYANIRRFLAYGLSGGLAEVLVMLLGPFLGFPVPLLPAQILWVNMLTHGLPGVALGAEPAERDAMRRRPDPRGANLLDRALAVRVLGTGALITAGSLAAGWVAAGAGRPWQSVTFVVLGLSQLGVALGLRARRAASDRPNHGLAMAVAASVLLQLAAVLVAPLRDLLGTQPLAPAELAGCALVALVPGVAVLAARVWLDRRLSRRRCR